MTCKDCFHDGICHLQYMRGKKYKDIELSECSDFKDKLKIVELPCKSDETVYRIQNPWGMSILKVAGIHLFWNKNETRVKRHSYIVGLHEGLNISCRLPLKNFGKTIFLTKKEAEARLKELQND